MKNSLLIVATLIVGLSAHAAEPAEIAGKELADQLALFAAEYCKTNAVRYGMDVATCFDLVAMIAESKLRALADQAKTQSTN